MTHQRIISVWQLEAALIGAVKQMAREKSSGVQRLLEILCEDLGLTLGGGDKPIEVSTEPLEPNTWFKLKTRIAFWLIGKHLWADW